jgi:NAD(P)-dependent dehydrogenase (short-subunit alcohol dehydrogenase family)
VFELDGRVALVTGAGQGVGQGIVRVLARQGAAVAVNDLEVDRAEATVALVEEDGGKAVAVAFDVTDIGAVRAGVLDVEAALGAVDILVNNAGIPPSMATVQFRDMEPEQWRPYIDVNLYGVMNCVKATIDGMCERGWGRVITISSGAGTSGLGIGVSAYAAGKGGALSFMRHLAIETAKFGVTANTLALGLMGRGDGTPMPELARRVPLGRLGTGEDIGPAVVWLAAEGEWVTGQTIGLNGGSLTS